MSFSSVDGPCQVAYCDWAIYILDISFLHENLFCFRTQVLDRCFWYDFASFQLFYLSRRQISFYSTNDIGEGKVNSLV